MKHWKLALSLYFLSMGMSGISLAVEPIYISSELNQANLQGSGKLTFFGFHIYDAALYRGAKNSSADFALDLRYQKSLSGTSIAHRTVDEMRKIGVPETQANAWGKELASFLPNVEPGQNLTAVYNVKQGTTFMHDGKKIAQVQGSDFAKAFFGIWLDQKTSVPKLREQLLGQGCQPPLLGESC